MDKKERIAKELQILEKEYHNTTTALNYGSPFQLLISTMLAAQSTDVRVNIVTKDFFVKLMLPLKKSIVQAKYSGEVGYSTDVQYRSIGGMYSSVTWPLLPL